jgi:hypothetical protein
MLAVACCSGILTNTINESRATLTPSFLSLPTRHLIHQGQGGPCLLQRSNFYHQLIMTHQGHICPGEMGGGGKITCDPDES